MREDGKEDDVFALIGPKRYDMPWKTLESRGYIAEAFCVEYRVPMSRDQEIRYAHASKRQQFRIAAENPAKTDLVRQLLYNHSSEQILVIGQYISQLQALSKDLDAPLITGKTKHAERELLYAAFRTGECKVLVVSESGEFRRRFARRQRADTGLGHVWFSARGSPAIGADFAPQGTIILLLHTDFARH